MAFLFESPVKTPEELPHMKYYPIFDRRWQTTIKDRLAQSESGNNGAANSNKSTKSTGKVKRSKNVTNSRIKPYPRRQLFKANEQFCLDLGQKDFDAQRCKTCNMLYTIGEVIDEKTHSEYHDMFVNSLKYREWKNEEIVANFEDGRVLRVHSNSPHFMLKKVDELFKVADLELGINLDLKSCIKPSSMFFIFVSLTAKRISGFVAAEKINSANWLVSEEPLMASTDEVPAECGVARIWTHPNFRRKRIATRLLDTLRHSFYPDKVISKQKLAFSDPTVVGKDFAKHYINSDQFLIYMYKHTVQ